MRDLQKYAEALAKCSRCKFCQAACPVYLEDLLRERLHHYDGAHDVRTHP